MNLNGSLNIGKRAIMTHAESAKVAGQNIANVNTPGYSRQRLELKSVFHSGNQGIDLLETRRIRDRFTDKHLRHEYQSLGNWELKSRLYTQIENVFLEPSEHGINSLLGEFWNSWEDVANNPESLSPRAMVVQCGISLAQAINRVDFQLKDNMQSINGYILDKVAEMNNIAKQVAYFNSQITFLEASGQEASGVRDSRDQLMDKLSRLVNVNVVERDNGAVALFIGGRAIVDNENFIALKIQQSPGEQMLINNVAWSDDNVGVDINNGELKGLLDMRDEVIPGLLGEMNQLASAIISSVNAIHENGYGFDGTTGTSFFTGSTAEDIAVNTELINDAQKVAASANSEVGDNSVALAIAGLSDETIAGIGTNIGRFYSDMVNSLGTRSQNASMMRESAEMLVIALEEQRESVSGVSLDEETANLIKFQRAYESAAQYMSVVNEMLQVLINMGT